MSLLDMFDAVLSIISNIVTSMGVGRGEQGDSLVLSGF